MEISIKENHFSVQKLKIFIARLSKEEKRRKKSFYLNGLNFEYKAVRNPPSPNVPILITIVTQTLT